MSKKCVGFIETWGLTACVAAADAAVKGGNVKLLGYEYAKGGGLCTVKVEGDVGACKAAIKAGKRAAETVKGTSGKTKSTLLKARPADQIVDKMIHNRETVGGEIALAEGYRPKGESRVPVLVRNWKPKTEPKVEETVIEETPVSPVEEDLKEESEAEDDSDPESQEPAMEVVVEETKEEAPSDEAVEVVEEAVVAPAVEETEEVVAPESVIAEEVVAPEPVETPVVEAPVDKEEAKETDKEKEADTSETETPKKSTSTGNRRRSRRKKKTDE